MIKLQEHETATLKLLMSRVAESRRIFDEYTALLCGKYRLPSDGTFQLSSDLSFVAEIPKQPTPASEPDAEAADVS